MRWIPLRLGFRNWMNSPAPPRRRLPRATLATALLLALGFAGWQFGPWHDEPGLPVPVVVTEPAPELPPAAELPSSAPVITTVTVSSGIPIKLIRHPRVVVPDAPYGAAFDKLIGPAQAGDTTSQYKLGLLLYECRDVPADGAALDQDIDTVYQTRRRGGWDVDDPGFEEQRLRQRFKDCEGVPASERGRYREWLRAAADVGMVEAQLDLPLHLPPGEYCQYMSECTPEQRAKQEALQAEAVDYLGRARDAGSITALWTLGAWQTEGDVMPQNLIEAYADFSALDQVYSAAGESSRFKAMLEDLRGKLRPIDIEQADARTREVLSAPNCCVLTP